MVKIFPARRGERSGEHIITFAGGVLRGSEQAKAKAFGAAPSSLGFSLQALDGREPRVVVIVIVNHLKPELVSIADKLCFPELILLFRSNVGIGKEQSWTYAAFYQAFDYGA